MNQFDIIIVGGGIAGLTSAIGLSKYNLKVLLIEKKSYPEHKVCGEYISIEAEQIFDLLEIDKTRLKSNPISKIVIAGNKKATLSNLNPGGFGYSRYELDHHLFEKAKQVGIEIHPNETVQKIEKQSRGYHIKTDTCEYYSTIVIGAHGKRSNIDHHLNRSFIQERTGYTGIKYHLEKTTMTDGVVGLYFFKGGYAGIINSTEKETCLCYMVENRLLKEKGDIRNTEKYMMENNIFLKDIIYNYTSLYKKPKTISELYFKSKSIHEEGILMCGDSAGMIAPLCGNGMTMAMQAGLIISQCIGKNYQTEKRSDAYSKIKIEYICLWNKQFKRSIQISEMMQGLFLNKRMHSSFLYFLHKFPKSINYISSITRKRLNL